MHDVRSRKPAQPDLLSGMRTTIGPAHRAAHASDWAERSRPAAAVRSAAPGRAGPVPAPSEADCLRRTARSGLGRNRCKRSTALPCLRDAKRNERSLLLIVWDHARACACARYRTECAGFGLRAGGGHRARPRRRSRSHVRRRTAHVPTMPGHRRYRRSVLQVLRCRLGRHSARNSRHERGPFAAFAPRVRVRVRVDAEESFPTSAPPALRASRASRGCIAGARRPSARDSKRHRGAASPPDGTDATIADGAARAASSRFPCG